MRIVFQGDSITDSGRVYTNDAITGHGYPLLVKGELGFAAPGKFEFLNRGINGNRIVDLYARMKHDIINLKPDVLSILIGVNDVWHEFGVSPNGVAADKYFKIYDMLIEELKAALPNLKIMILEPFILEDAIVPETWATMESRKQVRSEVQQRALMAKKIAEKHGLVFVPLQEGFDALCQQTPAAFWLSDGVHPTTMGHEYIKNQWMKAFQTLGV
jgi:lysophospholipase L1-like esterase